MVNILYLGLYLGFIMLLKLQAVSAKMYKTVWMLQVYGME